MIASPPIGTKPANASAPKRKRVKGMPQPASMNRAIQRRRLSSFKVSTSDIAPAPPWSKRRGGVWRVELQVHSRLSITARTFMIGVAVIQNRKLRVGYLDDGAK